MEEPRNGDTILSTFMNHFFQDLKSFSEKLQEPNPKHKTQKKSVPIVDKDYKQKLYDRLKNK